jgi:hypothetical protein
LRFSSNSAQRRFYFYMGVTDITFTCCLESLWHFVRKERQYFTSRSRLARVYESELNWTELNWPDLTWPENISDLVAVSRLALKFRIVRYQTCTARPYGRWHEVNRLDWITHTGTGEAFWQPPFLLILFILIFHFSTTLSASLLFYAFPFLLCFIFHIFRDTVFSVKMEAVIFFETVVQSVKPHRITCQKTAVLRISNL